MMTMQRDIEKVLYDREQIAARVRALGAQIARDLESDQIHSDEIILVPILTGSIVFLSDLIRHLPQKIRIGLVSVRSYHGRSTESKDLALRSEIPHSLEGKHVIIIDDILDTGKTLALISTIISEQQPATLKTCVLMRKRIAGAPELHADYIGFDIPDEFVVGYGLDYDDYYRNLPDIVTLRPEAL